MGVDKEKARELLDQLGKQEKLLTDRIGKLKEEDPFWFYRPSTSDIPPEARALMKRWVKEEDIPEKIFAARDIIACDADIVEMWGGNRAQKTVTAVISTICMITGDIPTSIKDIWPERLLPQGKTTAIRHYAKTAKAVEDVLEPAYRYWVPKKYWHKQGWERTYSSQKKVLKLYKDGTDLIGTVSFWTYEQLPSAAQGATLNGIMFDEYPTEAHFNEAIWRMTTGKGVRIFIAATPTEGLSSIYEKLRELEKDLKYRIKAFEVPTITNPFVNLDAVELALANLEYEEVLVRLLGQHRSLSGFIFKGPNAIRDGIHIIPPKELEYTRYFVVRGLDPHVSKEACCVEMAIDPHGKKHVIGAYFEDASIEEVKRALAQRAVDRQYRLGWTCFDKSLDYAAEGYKGMNILDEYRKPPNQIPAMIPSQKFKGSKDAAVDLIKRDLTLDPNTGLPSLFFWDTPEVMRVVRDLRTLERDKARNEDKRGKRDQILATTKDFFSALMYIYQQHLDWCPPDEDESSWVDSSGYRRGPQKKIGEDRYV